MKLHRQSEFCETRTVRLSGRLTVEITVGPGGIVCEWTPTRPARPLTGKEQARYRQTRDELLARLAGRMGGSVVCVEV